MSATGLIGKALEATKTAIAATTPFQTWTGAANANAALAYIFIGAVADASATTPCVTISPSTHRVETFATNGMGEHTGSIFVKFENSIASGDTTQGAQMITFEGLCDTVMEAFRKLGGTYIEPKNVRLSDAGFKKLSSAERISEADNFIWAEYEFDYSGAA